MLIWRHDYLARKNHIYSCWVDVEKAKRLPFFPGNVPTSIWLSIVRSTGWPITIDVSCEMRCIQLLCFFFGIPNFGIGILISWFFNSGIEKINPTVIFGIKNGSGIPLSMGVPEIGTKNWNSQPSFVGKPFKARELLSFWRETPQARQHLLWTDQQPTADDIKYSRHRARWHGRPTNNMFKVWQNSATCGGRPIRRRRWGAVDQSC